MSIDQQVAPYFKRRKLIANQVIEKELEGENYVVSPVVQEPYRIRRGEKVFTVCSACYITV